LNQLTGSSIPPTYLGAKFELYEDESHIRDYQALRSTWSVKGMSLLVQPVIAIMMLLITWSMATDAVHSIGYIHSIIIALFAFLALSKFKIHPAFVIILAFAYGGIIIPMI
jgi:chromate transport protein ChrA